MLKKALVVKNGVISEVDSLDVISNTNESSPVLSYASGVLSRIDYASGHYKLLSYTLGKLTQIDYVVGTKTIRKTLSYNSAGSLLNITQVDI